MEMCRGEAGRGGEEVVGGGGMRGDSSLGRIQAAPLS